MKVMAKTKKRRIVVKFSVSPICEKYSYIVLTKPLSGIFSPEISRKTGIIVKTPIVSERHEKKESITIINDLIR